MIEALLESKKISPQEFKLYKLFASELGMECLKTMMSEMFWEEPDEMNFTREHFAFYDGRRSVLRGIKATIDKVDEHIRKQNLKDPND